MNNNETSFKKVKSQANETIRNYKVSNNEDNGQADNSVDQFSDEDQENQDIADVHQWKEQYNLVRHELFDHNQLNILKLLALNKTTKLKHRIVIMSSEEDENNYDRQRERELIFKKIKGLRLEMRIYKENKRSKKMKPEQLHESIDMLEKKFDDLKLEQMNIFNQMESEKVQIEEAIQRMDKKITDYEDDNDSDCERNDQTHEKDKQNNFQDEEDEADNDNTHQKGKKYNENAKLTRLQKQNSQINLYEVNEVAEEYNDGNESLMVKNEAIQPSSRRLTKNQLQSKQSVSNVLDSDEDEEEELREILQQAGIIYGQENQEQQEEEQIDFEITISNKLKHNKNENHSKVTKNRRNSNSNKENIDQENHRTSNTNLKSSVNDKNKNKYKDNHEQNEQEHSDSENENNYKQDNNDDDNNEDNENDEDDNDADEDIMRDELNYQLKQGKQQKKQIEEEKDELQNIKNQIEDMDNDLSDLKENIDRISSLMKNLGDRNLGWLKEDHQDFLRVRSKHKNDVTSTKFLDECITAIPVHSKDEIEEHAQLYLTYLAYDQEKKETLKRYKDIKDAKTKLEEDLKLHRSKMHEELLIKKKLKKTKEELMEERLKKKDIIMVWKQNKMSYRNDIVQQEIEEKRILQNIDKEKRLKEERIRDERKQLIKQYQDQKEQERKKLKELEELKVHEKVKKKISYTDLTRIKAKEEFMVRKKQIRLIEKKILTKEEGDNIQRIQLLNKEKFSYVEPRLTEPTKAAERRITQKFDNQGKIDRFGPSGESFAGNPLGLGGRLKVPSWRSSNI